MRNAIGVARVLQHLGPALARRQDTSGVRLALLRCVALIGLRRLWGAPHTG